MKTLIVFSLFLSCVAFAKEVKDFNKVLIQNVQKDIDNDNDQAFKKPATRAPASVEEIQPEDQRVDEDQKFNKMNNRQIGPSKW